ncbi:tRNA threonylcarbamoyladenosine biosynthesis protein TsaE [Caulobacter sp. Root655]|uniref:tRNA (adenosine(37)-N6)-threonylcarbamoyltransferase complex ATPase subunit type 1 TsaE n=1 Tax=Caulobacter sp. Root655 TaxID=1736578 RepID=UPI0006F6EA22|nr:tRNA (adenosine(37)-N6)-threonylcarbamoyltransferase complex ATPase subunit type 1 TsaE [Caulobacter sp. Root655]KRA65811.1 tRNA threonylcarbamoyladenosine biosynthesis protein TsaE [Caulobacter sp. Root655]
MIEVSLPDEAATQRLGLALSRALRPGDAVCLTGPLGAGKSTLARAMVRALTTPDEEVPSPTFTLVQFYDGPDFPVAHFDLYRVTDPDEAYEIGLEEALEDGAALIEWPQRLQGRLPANRLDIDITPIAGEDGEARRAVLTAHGTFEGRKLEL